MFKSVILAEALRDALDAVTPLSDEVKFSISPDGIKLKAVDPANIAMVFLELPSAAFEYYKADACELGIDLVRLGDALSMADKGENVQIELDEESHKLKVGVGSLSYTVGLIDPTAIGKEPRIPDVDLPTSVTLDGRVLHKALKAAEKVSDHVVLGISDDIFYMEAKGDIDSLKLKIPATELIGLKPGESRSLFSLDYCVDFAKSAAKAGEVTLEMGIDYPMRMLFQVNKYIKVIYMLAPRIEQE
jgi:proliferating cell nuclear antigen